MTARRPSNADFDVASAIRRERLDLCEYLQTCAATEWSTPSLCSGWTIRDVVAHLSLTTNESWRGFVFGMIKYRGDFDRMVAMQARHHSERHTPEVLIDQLRRSADSSRRAPGSAPIDPLLDLLVHGQDITRPLGIERQVPTMAAIEATDHAVTSRWYGAKKRFAGLQLNATDAQWTYGTGMQVNGPVVALLLVATGRAAGLPDLNGPGVDTLADRLR
jgi:uncharacterized protein (TIGR03083 family)